MWPIKKFRTSAICLKNFYQELGIKPSASESEVKKAYFSLAKKWHPDVNPNADARTNFEKITKAYETLSDQVKRDQYDQQNGLVRSKVDFTGNARKTVFSDDEDDYYDLKQNDKRTKPNNQKY